MSGRCRSSYKEGGVIFVLPLEIQLSRGEGFIYVLPL